MAAVIYVAGLCAVLYVAYFVPYLNPEEDQSMSAIDNWGLLVTGMAFIYISRLSTMDGTLQVRVLPQGREVW